jgi:hypothetical protein
LSIMRKIVLLLVLLVFVSGLRVGATAWGVSSGISLREKPQEIEIGAQVNNEIAMLPTVTQNSQTWAQGTVNIPVGVYRQHSTIVINSPYVNVHCEAGTILAYMGSGDAIRIIPTAQISGDASTQPNQGPSVENCSIYNLSPNAISGIHGGDISKIHLNNVAINNFNGTPISSGFWFDNTVSFTEGMALVDLSANNNSIAMRFTNTAGSPLTQSFGYTSIRGFRAQVRTNQIGFSVEDETLLYHSFVDAIVETSDATGTAFSVTGAGKVGGDAGDDVIFLRAECVNVSGPCTGSTLLNLGPTAQFVANGFMNGLGTSMITTIAPGAVLTWNGTTELNGSTNNFGWNGDNSILMRFGSIPAVAIFSNNMRLGGSYVLGWSTAPTTAGDYVGFSPCVTGTPLICLGNGMKADSSGGLEANMFSASQFVGNSALPLISAGTGAGVSPANVTLAPGSTSVSGTIVFKTGISPAASATVATITFATPLGTQPGACIPAAENTATAMALHSLFLNSPTTAGFILSSGSIPLVPSTEFRVGYACF